MLWLDQFLTLAFSTWISLKFSMFHWICLLFILLILVGDELSSCLVVAVSCDTVSLFLESG